MPTILGEVVCSPLGCAPERIAELRTEGVIG
jgi:hypothetical protein